MSTTPCCRDVLPQNMASEWILWNWGQGKSPPPFLVFCPQPWKTLPFLHTPFSPPSLPFLPFHLIFFPLSPLLYSLPSFLSIFPSTSFCPVLQTTYQKHTHVKHKTHPFCTWKLAISPNPKDAVGHPHHPERPLPEALFSLSLMMSAAYFLVCANDRTQGTSSISSRCFLIQQSISVVPKAVSHTRGWFWIVALHSTASLTMMGLWTG